jgi:hypothetical protein
MEVTQMVDNYQLLANAIIAQAAVDYRKVLVDEHCGSTQESKSKLRELKKFFHGETIKLYTTLNGPELMEAIEQEVIKFNYDLKALYKSRKEKVYEEET